jgi:hypothetical protein
MNNEQKKDTRFSLRSFFAEQSTQNELKGIQREIERKGFMNGIRDTDNYTVKFYNSGLAIIFCINTLHGESLNKNEESKKEILNSLDYFNTYVEAYKEGRQYFDQNFAISADTLCGGNLTNFIKDLHQNYFHTQHFSGNEGWQFVKQFSRPFILTHKEIKKFGYYSGIVSKADEMIEKYSNTLEGFFKCFIPESMKNGNEQEIKPSRTKQLIIEEIKTIDVKGWEYSFRSEMDYNTFTDLLTNYFEHKEYSLPKTIIRLQKACKTKLAKALREIHKKLSENTLISDVKYFEIIKCLNHFEKETDLYKVIAR